MFDLLRAIFYDDRGKSVSYGIVLVNRGTPMCLSPTRDPVSSTNCFSEEFWIAKRREALYEMNIVFQRLVLCEWVIFNGTAACVKADELVENFLATSVDERIFLFHKNVYRGLQLPFVSAQLCQRFGMRIRYRETTSLTNSEKNETRFPLRHNWNRSIDSFFSI